MPDDSQKIAEPKTELGDVIYQSSSFVRAVTSPTADAILRLMFVGFGAAVFVMAIIVLGQFQNMQAFQNRANESEGEKNRMECRQQLEDSRRDVRTREDEIRKWQTSENDKSRAFQAEQNEKNRMVQAAGTAATERHTAAVERLEKKVDQVLTAFKKQNGGD